MIKVIETFGQLILELSHDNWVIEVPDLSAALIKIATERRNR
jgi:hypothetical protein